MRRPRWSMSSGPGPVLASALVAVSAAWALGACTTDYQKGLDDPRFGLPNALGGEEAPGPTAGGGGREGGAASNVVCVSDGMALVDGGACSVSFSKDVLPILGNSTCAQTACHGGLNPPSPPRIEPGDPAGAWAIFAAFKISNGTPYINPCSTDKTKSAISCNLAATGTCGTKMPQGAGQIPDDELAKIDTWLACGSPNN